MKIIIPCKFNGFFCSSGPGDGKDGCIQAGRRLGYPQPAAQDLLYVPAASQRVRHEKPIFMYNPHVKPLQNDEKRSGCYTINAKSCSTR